MQILAFILYLFNFQLEMTLNILSLKMTFHFMSPVLHRVLQWQWKITYLISFCLTIFKRTVRNSSPLWCCHCYAMLAHFFFPLLRVFPLSVLEMAIMHVATVLHGAAISLSNQPYISKVYWPSLQLQESVTEQAGREKDKGERNLLKEKVTGCWVRVVKGNGRVDRECHCKTEAQVFSRANVWLKKTFRGTREKHI